MYRGLLPPCVDEADLSSDDEEFTGENRHGESETNGHRLRQSGTEPHSACVRLENNRIIDFIFNDALGDDCPPGVSLDKWQKFKELQRVKADKKVRQPQTKQRQRKGRYRKDGTSTQSNDAEQKRKLEEKQEENWKGLTQYFDINDRFKPSPCNRSPLMSGLEKSMESAIAEGDYGKAEELSDRLATRELAVKIAQAADCRDLARTKRQAEASREAQKRRKQIAWGFEAKKRWETKSNMGYM